MPRRPLLAALALAFLLGLAAPASADAALRATASIKTASGATRIVVKLSSPRALPLRSRPRTVKVKAGRKTYALARLRGSAVAAAVSYGTWRSAGARGAAAKPLVALAGRRITVLVATRAGTVTLKPAVPKLTGGGQTPGGQTPGGQTPGGQTPGGTPLFAPPGRDLTGQEALNSIKGYIANSRFTDCVAGWPNCSVEQRYSFCPNGVGAAYRRLTPTSGADINSFYSIVEVIGAEQKADGSFGFQVKVQLGTSDSYYVYLWRVSTAGVATGTYWAQGRDPRNGDAPDEQLGPLQYARGVGDGDC